MDFESVVNVNSKFVTEAISEPNVKNLKLCNIFYKYFK